MNKTFITILALCATLIVGFLTVGDKDNTVGAALEYNEAATGLAIQFGTLKAINSSESITSEGVIEFIDGVGTIFESSESVSLSKAFTLIREQVPWSDLDAEGKLLVEGIISVVETEVTRRVELGEVNEDSLLTIQSVLEYIRRGAILAED